MTNLMFPSLSALFEWAGHKNIQTFDDGLPTIVSIVKDELYYFFEEVAANSSPKYVLKMTSVFEEPLVESDM